MARSGPRPQFMPTMSAPAARRLARDLGRALAPHRAVAVVQLLVLEEHGGHHRQVGGRLAGPDGRHRLLREHHGLDREEVHAALGQGLGLLPEGRRRTPRRWPRCRRRRTRRAGSWWARWSPPRSRPAGRPRGPAARPSRSARGCGRRSAYSFSLSRAAPEGVGLHQIGARREVAAVDPADDVGVRVVPELGAGAVERGRRRTARCRSRRRRRAGRPARTRSTTSQPARAAPSGRSPPRPAAPWRVTTASVESFA